MASSALSIRAGRRSHPVGEPPWRRTRRRSRRPLVVPPEAVDAENREQEIQRGFPMELPELQPGVAHETPTSDVAARYSAGAAASASCFPPTRNSSWVSMASAISAVMVTLASPREATAMDQLKVGKGLLDD